MDLLTEATGDKEKARYVFSILNGSGVLSLDLSDSGADRIVKAFKRTYKVPSVRPTDEKAAKVLAKEYGADNVIQIIKVMSTMTAPYKPSINHIKDIETKWLMIERYLTDNQQRDIGF